jgi:hypothetical protein
MPGRQLVTRESLQRELVVNAATKPLAIGVAAGVAVFAFVLGVPWLLILAPVLYVSLALATFFDGDEAERVGRAAYERARPSVKRRVRPRGLAPGIGSLVERARVEEERILSAVAESDLEFTEVSIEVESLAAEMERIAGRAQVISDYLDQQRPQEVRQRLRAIERETGASPDAARARERAALALRDQLGVYAALEAELQRFGAEMEHLIASLGVVHGQLVRVRVAGEAHLQEDVAGQVRELREHVGAVADGMQAAVAQLGDERDDAT